MGDTLWVCSSETTFLFLFLLLDLNPEPDAVVNLKVYVGPVSVVTQDNYEEQREKKRCYFPCRSSLLSSTVTMKTHHTTRGWA